MSKRPTDPKPPAEPVDLLDFADESTDVIELNIDLDAGIDEPIGELGFDEEPVADPRLELSTDEPDASAWADEAPIAHKHRWADDLEDFATQEELPILPWKLDVELLQLGLTVLAVLDPTAARTVWMRPNPDADRIAVTLRIRMLDLPVTLQVIDGPESVLRIGRDVLGGRVLVSCG